ncbi:MAG TPA: HAD family acid phosphatase [Bryobacteraceae bacterium]|jgi:acid phosphatase
MRRGFLLIFTLCLWARFAAPDDLAARDQSALNSTLWAGTAVEHDAATLQTYRLAGAMLDKALEDRTWTAAIEQRDTVFRRLPPAIIMDIDETILDNSPFQALLLTKDVRDDDPVWNSWVAQAQAKPLSGAVEFARYAHSRGVAVFYVTNRDASQKPATWSNLARAGFPLDRDLDTLYCAGERPAWGKDKTTRRAEIARHYRILLLFGDDLNDFVSGANASVADRRKLAEPYQDYWGSKWFILPNAMYGSWEKALYDPATNPNEAETLRLKYEAIREMLDGAGAGAATQ